MKRLISIVLAIIVATIIFVPCNAFWNEGQSETDFVFSYHNGGYWLDKYVGNDMNVEIPSEYNNYPVTFINSDAFAGNTNVKSVVIPEGVTHISGDLYIGESWGMSKGAFEDCTSLEKVDLPSTITHINFDAFKNTKIVNSQNGAKYVDNWLVGHGDKTVSSVNIKSGTKGIGEAVFSGFSSLKKVTLPDSVRIINDYAFYNSALSSITLPEGLVDIEGSVFCKTKIESIYIPKSVKSIGYEAFAYTPLKSVILPDKLEAIGNGAFESTKLTEIVIPKKVTKLDSHFLNGTFENCKNLKKVTFKGKITEIGEAAFKNCPNLTIVSPLKFLEKIGFWAFEDCVKLEKLDFGNNLKSIGHGAFRNTALLNNLTGLVKYYNNWVIDSDSDIKTAHVKEGTVGIAEDAFQIRYYLEKVSLPDSLKYICNDAFYCCPNLKEVNIPDNVVYIGAGAFRNVPINQVLLPEGLEAVTGRTNAMGSWGAFQGSSVKTVYIPSTVKEIGRDAFEGTDITNVYYAGTKSDWQKIQIASGNTSITNAQIHYNTPIPSSGVKTLNTVSGVKGTRRVDSITIKWNEVKKAQGYILEQYVDEKWVRVTKTSNLSYTVKNLSPKTSYKFRIKAYMKNLSKTVYSKYNTFSFTTK